MSYRVTELVTEPIISAILSEPFTGQQRQTTREKRNNAHKRQTTAKRTYTGIVNQLCGRIQSENSRQDTT